MDRYFFENTDFLLQLIDCFDKKLQYLKNLLMNQDCKKLKEFILVANELRNNLDKL